MLVARMKFGSHLYGTSTPASDLDYKRVFIPDAKSILLGRANTAAVSSREKAMGEKNLPGEIDEEFFTLQKYLMFLAEGQTVALDMLFAPDWAMTDEPLWIWEEIKANKDRLLTKKVGAFLGYAQKQAGKYGIKGSRVAAARAALTLLQGAVAKFGGRERLEVIQADIEKLSDGAEHMDIFLDVQSGKPIVAMWEVCNRKMPYRASLQSAMDLMQRVVDEYGKRALMAETNEGVDWKAMSHAIRIGQEALELLETGSITFPRPNAEELIGIKTGQLPYKDVASDVEKLFETIEAAAPHSSLRDEPDIEWIEDFVADIYRSEALNFQRSGWYESSR